MTRGEERQQAAEDYCNNLIREATFGQFVAHKAGSKWADETMIDKACKWLHTALYLDHERSIEHRYATLEELLNDFRKAMKGGE